jgi:HEAT repeat protein
MDQDTTMQSILQIINSEEPEYARAQQMGPEAIEPLKKLTQAKDVLLASKAVSFASRIQSDQALEVLTLAASRPEPEIRVAVAGGLENLGQQPIDDILNQLLGDEDFGVRQFALETFAATQAPGSVTKVQSIAQNDPEPFLRALAGFALRGEDPPPDLYLMPARDAP